MNVDVVLLVRQICDAISEGTEMGASTISDHARHLLQWELHLNFYPS